VLILLGPITLLAIRRTGIRFRKPALPSGLPDDAVPCEPGLPQIVCKFCDGTYYSDRLRCPYCGAPKSNAKS